METDERKEALIKELCGMGYLSSERVVNAFRTTPRERFIRPGDAAFAYSDYPLEIGHGQTISAPHMVAMMTELLEPDPTDVVLEVGAGSGYQAAVLSKLVKCIYTIELEGELVKTAARNLQSAGCSNVRVMMGDGSKGYPPAAPFNKIIVTCATPEIFKAWVDQLAAPGLLLAPVGGFYHQKLTKLRKTKDGLERELHGGCVFVPLRHG